MQITRHNAEGRHELRLAGRFDANWSEHVGNAIESAIRAGNHRIDLDLSAVHYLSSAGIRVLLKYYKQLQSAHGALRVIRAAEAIIPVFQLSGIAGLLMAEGKAAPETAVQSETRRWERNGSTFEAYQQGGQELNGYFHGDPDKFGLGQLTTKDSVRLRFDADTIGLGLGAFGTDPQDCIGRFGEFLGVCGTTLAQPTDGSSMPDFQVIEGQFLPEVNMLYGLTARGGFSHLVRFEAAGEHGAITLAELVEAGLEELRTSALGLVVVAESTSLVGATLRQSPATANGQSPWQFPGVRDWLSFTTEESDEQHVAVIVGFATRAAPNEATRFFRPIGPGTSAQGHFHAATFRYRPLRKGNIPLGETVAGLLGHEAPQAVLHLLADEREFEGVGQTELMRGACWVSPLVSLSRFPKT